MGTVEPQVVAGTDVKLISSGQIVAKMLKQEGIKHIYVRVNHSHI
jgi:acetolactate synthase I/II/III large subunit